MGIEIRSVPKEQGVKHLQSLLAEQLQAGKRVLWLVSGGSNVDIECQIYKQLTDLEGLSTALIDERYGEPGHKDSNYQKLVDGGFAANLTPVLVTGLDIDNTTAQYSEKLEKLLDEADVVIAQLGIGADGHTNGVLPDSPIVNSKKLVEQYKGSDFGRITMTLEALRFVDVVFVFAYGQDKKLTLTRLTTEDVSLDEQPSQILKQLPEVYLYNDSIEGGHE